MNQREGLSSRAAAGRAEGRSKSVHLHVIASPAMRDRLGRLPLGLGRKSRGSLARVSVAAILVLGNLSISYEPTSAYRTCTVGKWTTNSKKMWLRSSVPTAFDSPAYYAHTQWDGPNTGSIFDSIVPARGNNQDFSVSYENIHGSPWYIPTNVPAFADGAQVKPHFAVTVRLSNLTPAPGGTGFSWGTTMDYYSSPRKVDRTTILVHEMGHAMGLAHPYDCTSSPTSAELSSVMNVTWTLKQQTTADDRAGMRGLYG